MTFIGKVRDLTREFEWSIGDFFSLPEEVGKCYDSPSFTFAGESWYLSIYPNVRSEYNSIGYIGVFLNRKMSGSSIGLAWSLGVKTFDGKKDHVSQHAHTFEKADGRGRQELLKRSVLLEKKTELVPSDILTLFCALKLEKDAKSADDGEKIVTAKCSYCKEVFGSKYISPHEHKCFDKPVRCATCRNVVPLRRWFDHKCEDARVKANEKLVEDLVNLIDSEKHSDVTIHVKDKVFRLHKSILAGRNPYFDSMFTTEMMEKNTGIVSIDDCEPDIFHSFLYYVYTGKLQVLSSDNVCALYEVADKYHEDQLKEECLCFMKNDISVDSFCDFIVLALKHDEKELLQHATDLFCKNIKGIIQSVKWQTFLQEYPTQANELHIKALEYYVK